VGLLDFGATRDFSKDFVDDYFRLVWAAAERDRDTIQEVSIKLGFLTGHESKAMLNAHIESGLVVGEPFASSAPFDFKASGITTRVAQHGATFVDERLTAPPNEVYSLHRKLAGAFLICIRMGAVMPCRDLLEEVRDNYKFGPVQDLRVLK
jgi:aarF domain-containing kinase